MEYFKEQFSIFFQSFKFKKNFLYMFLYDLLFFIIAVVFVKLFGYILAKMGEGIDFSIFNNVLKNPSPAEMEIMRIAVMNAKIVIWGLIIAIILYLVIILFAWSFSKGNIYNILLKKKFDKNFYSKFFSLNLLIYIPVLIVFFAFIYLIKEIPQFIYLLMFLILVLLYFLTLAYVYFVKERKVFLSISKALEFGFTKFHKMLVCLILIAIVFFIMSFISANIAMRLSYLIRSYVSLIIYLLYAAWARIYFVKVASKPNL